VTPLQAAGLRTCGPFAVIGLLQFAVCLRHFAEFLTSLPSGKCYKQSDPAHKSCDRSRLPRWRGGGGYQHLFGGETFCRKSL